MSPGGDEVGFNVSQLMQAARHLDAHGDSAKTIKSTADSISISGHEWGLVGIAFSASYSELSAGTREHIGMIAKFLTTAEGLMTATARQYAGADKAVLAEINVLEKDPVEFRPAPKK